MKPFRFVWTYQCLFGFVHRWTSIVNNIRVVVEKRGPQLPVWRVMEKDTWEPVASSEDSFETVEAAMDGAELWWSRNNEF